MLPSHHHELFEYSISFYFFTWGCNNDTVKVYNNGFDIL